VRRLLAVLGAVAMVALAVVARNAIDDDSGDEGRAAVVHCASDLAEYCAALDVEYELVDAADTYALAVDGDTAGIDAWITTSAWMEVLASRGPEAMGEGVLLARSPVEVAADPARAAALRALCGDQPIFGCLGEHAGSAWGDLGGQAAWGTLKTGLPDAASALGLAVLPTVAGGFFGNLDFATNDFELDDFSGWLDRLAQPSRHGEADPASTLVTRQGTYSTAASTTAQLDGLSRPVERFAVVPAVQATVVLMFFAGAEVGVDPDGVREALVDAGWAPAGGDLEPTLKDGVLAALYTLWTEVTR
jgi:hypothetical protein